MTDTTESEKVGLEFVVFMQQQYARDAAMFGNAFEAAAARGHAVTSGIKKALERRDVVFGGTVRQYEQLLDEIEAALYPSHEEIQRWKDNPG
jgi:hypothetical protein